MLPEKREKNILLLSLSASVAFVAAEFAMAWHSGSRTVLMDSAFDGVELVITGISVMLAPLLYRPVTERHPFGFSQCESLFLIVKGFMLGLVTVSQIVSNLRIMLTGGNHIDTGAVAAFELAVALACVAMLALLQRCSRVCNSPILQAEIYGWRVDSISSVCVALAFFLPPLFAGTPLAALTPYFDQAIAIALSLMILPRPIRLVVQSLRELLLFAPPQATVQALHGQIAEICAGFAVQLDFLDLVQTGRKTWVEVTIRCSTDDVPLSRLKALYRQILPVLQQHFTEVDLEIIPALDSPAQAAAE